MSLRCSYDHPLQQDVMMTDKTRDVQRSQPSSVFA